jgi:hypothetical protein
MRRNNFALRLQPSLLEEARDLAKAEGVALNQFINVAVAEKVATMRTVAFFAERSKCADIPRALEILRKAGAGNPPIEGDELPEGAWLDDRLRVRIEPRKQFVVEQLLSVYKDTEEGQPLIDASVPAGQVVFADPDYWKGVRWNGFEIVKLSTGAEWLCARREEFLRCAQPVEASEREISAISA